MKPNRILVRRITYCREPATVACDLRCEKAWGASQRPRVQFSENEDDFEWLADDELGTAPANPGTYEGFEGKPTGPGGWLDSKWCIRECERCVMSRLGESGAPLKLRDFSTRLKNIPVKAEESI